MTDPRPFEGDVAFVTGAASGIGEATAHEFASQGAAVAVADVAVEQGEAVAEAIRSTGGNATFVECDVRVEEQIVAAIDHTVASLGRVDYAYNNAGIGAPFVAVADVDNDDWNAVMEVNLRGVWWCMKHELRHMLPRGSGAIVNCASICGLMGLPFMSSYVASKHAVVGLTKAAALDYAQSGIRINAVCPGGIFSGGAAQAQAAMTQEERDAMDALVLEKQPIGRWGQPSEIATAVTFLCGPGASLMLGHALVVDGGTTVQ